MFLLDGLPDNDLRICLSRIQCGRLIGRLHRLTMS